ncbi:MAG: FAD/NAD(P)-binding oxidoreductase [Nitrososphaerota archaeon]
MKKVLILGGGVGGTIVANVLARKVSPSEANITLVDATGKHTYQPGFIYVAFSDAKPENLVRNERSLLDKHINLIIDEAILIESNERRVRLKSGRILEYDYLVVATGARLCPEELPGFKAAHHFYDLDASIRLRRALDNFPGGRVVIGIGGIPYKCPPAPAEAACQLDYYFTRRGSRHKAEIHYLSPLPRVFPLESVAPLVQEIMESKNIQYIQLFNVERIEPEKGLVHSLEGESLKYDLLIVVPPHKGAKVIEDSGLGDKGGWIPTDKYTLRVKGYDDIYAIGDATDIPISKAGATAHYEAKIVAENIAAEIKGSGMIKRYDGKVRCFCDAGFKKGITMVFDYEHPPKPTRLSRKWYYAKMLVGKLYWSLVLKGWA